VRRTTLSVALSRNHLVVARTEVVWTDVVKDVGGGWQNRNISTGNCPLDHWGEFLRHRQRVVVNWGCAHWHL